MAYYLLFINTVAFITTAVQSRKKKIEDFKFLFFPAFIGGAFGAVAASRIFNYQRDSLMYRLVLPVIFILECFLYCFAISLL